MKRLTGFFLFTIFINSFVFGQSSSDALRYSSSNGFVGSRAYSMGGAYAGVSDDYSATFWNPAGLAQMRRLEITGGISQYSLNNNATYLGTSATNTTSATGLNNLGFVFPFPTVKGSMVFAFGYNRLANFASSLTFGGFNSQSSIIPSFFVEGKSTYNIPYRVFLTDTNGTNSSVLKNVNQQGTVVETGNLGQWSFAGAVDIEENISFGVSLNIISGSYSYTRNYLEEDTKDVFKNSNPKLTSDSAYLRFNKFYLDNFVESEVSGSGLTFGLMYRSDIFRIGLTAKAPTSITIHESYRDVGQAFYDTTGGWLSNVPETYHTYPPENHEYGVKSPWVLGGGASVYVLPILLLAADVDYTDWTQIAWTDNATLQQDPSVGNIKLASFFRPTTNYHVGAELDVPSTDVKLRAGYSRKPSPYKNDPSSFDQVLITGGAGILLQRNIMVDAAIGFGNTKTFVNQYSGIGARTDETISTTQVNVSVSYRF